MSRPTLIFALLALLVSACGPGSDNNDNNTKSVPDMGPEDTGAAVDMGTVAEDTAPQYVCPNEGEKVCGDKCINVLISMDHCGECNNSCVRGEMTCRGESGCECLGDNIMCDGRCYDPNTTREHCGDCDTVCPSTDACVDGDCIEISTNPAVLGVLDATNEGRSEQQDCGVNGIKNPVGGVQLNEQLNIAAQVHAEDMAANNFMGHVGSDDTQPFERAIRAGYPTANIGENVGRGYDTAEEAVAGWIDSDGHCSVLMNGDYDEMGVGHAISPTGEHFWAQVFGWQ